MAHSIRRPFTVQPLKSEEILAYVETGRKVIYQQLRETPDPSDCRDVDSDSDSDGDSEMEGISVLKRQRSTIRTSDHKAAALAWEQGDYNPADAMAPIKRALQDLTVGSEYACIHDEVWTPEHHVNTDAYGNGGPNVGLEWRLSGRQGHANRAWSILSSVRRLMSGKQGHGNRTSAATAPSDDDCVRTVLNPIDGVIIAQSLLSPSAGKGVPLRAWDDLTWFQWARMHDPARKNKSDEHYRDFNRIFWHVTTDRIPLMRHWLHWIVFQGLKEPEETLRVIATGMASRGFRDGAVPDWEHRLTFPVGHWCYYALLAAPVSRGAADLLRERTDRNALRQKSLSSVTIFFGDEVGDDESIHWPTLVWEVCDHEMEPKSGREVDKVSGQWHDKEDFVHKAMPITCEPIGKPKGAST